MFLSHYLSQRGCHKHPTPTPTQNMLRSPKKMLYDPKFEDLAQIIGQSGKVAQGN